MDAMTLLGAGLMIPAIALLTQSDVARTSPALHPALHALGTPSQQSLVIGGMLVLVGVYLIKTLFLAVLAWRQTRFAFGVQAHLSHLLCTNFSSSAPWIKATKTGGWA
jgi:hypothetical protein